jgi:hypothetical protein
VLIIISKEKIDMSKTAQSNQSNWLSQVTSRFRNWFSPSQSLPDLVNSPRLIKDTRQLACSASKTPSECKDLIAWLTFAELSRQIGALEIDQKVCHVLEKFNKEPSQVIPQSATISLDRQWTHWHALTWYACRFCPRSYLEIHGDGDASMAMVGINSPETNLFTFKHGQIQRQKFSGRGRGLTRSQAVPKAFDLIFVDGSRELRNAYRYLKLAFWRCGVGGLVVFRGSEKQELRLPGQYRPRLQGYWERLPLRYPGFQYLKAPGGIEVGLAFRCH